MRLNLEMEFEPRLSLLAEHRLQVAYRYLCENESQWDPGFTAHRSITRQPSKDEKTRIQREVAHLTKVLDKLDDNDDETFEDELDLSLERAADLSTLLTHDVFRAAAGHLRAALQDEIFYQSGGDHPKNVSETIAAGIFMFMRFEEYLSARYSP